MESHNKLAFGTIGLQYSQSNYESQYSDNFHQQSHKVLNSSRQMPSHINNIVSVSSHYPPFLNQNFEKQAHELHQRANFQTKTQIPHNNIAHFIEYQHPYNHSALGHNQQQFVEMQIPFQALQLNISGQPNNQIFEQLRGRNQTSQQMRNQNGQTRGSRSSSIVGQQTNHFQPFQQGSQNVIKSRVISEIQREKILALPQRNSTIIRGDQVVWHSQLIGSQTNQNIPNIHERQRSRPKQNNSQIFSNKIQQVRMNNYIPFNGSFRMENKPVQHVIHHQVLPNIQMAETQHLRYDGQHRPTSPVSPSSSFGVQGQQISSIFGSIASKNKETIYKMEELSGHNKKIGQFLEIMVRGEGDVKKQEFIRNLVEKEHKIMMETVNCVLKELSEVQQQSLQLKSYMEHQLQIEREKSESKSKQSKEVEAEKQSLRKEIEVLKKQNSEIKEKLRKEELEMENDLEKELSDKIQSQKLIIKKLEQELMQRRDEPQSQQSKNIIQFQQEIENQMESKYLTIIESKEDYINELQAEIIRHKTQIKSLKQQITKQRNQKYVSLTGEEEIEKLRQMQQNKNFQDPASFKVIEKLNSIVKEKNQELQNLKQKIFEVQDEYDLIIDQKNEKIKELHERGISLTEETRKKTQQCLQSEKLIHEKQVRIQSLTRQLQRYANLSEDYKLVKKQKQQLEEFCIQRDNQQIRLKQEFNGILEENSEMQKQINTKNNEIQYLNKNIESYIAHITELKTQIHNYEGRVKDLEQKGSVEQQKQQKEVKRLKSIISELQKNVKKLEESQVQQFPVFNRNMDNEEKEKNDFRDQYSQSQVKIFELEAALKSKESKIKQLETNIQTLNLKINHYGPSEESLRMKKQIEILRKKIAEFEAEKFRQKKNRSYEYNSLFENKIIYNLKSQNEKLKVLVGAAKSNKNGSRPSSTLHQLTSRIHSKNPSSQSPVTVIQARLEEFNNKLQNLININKNLKNQTHYEVLDNQPTAQLLAYVQKQRQKLIRRHYRQIQNLQARLIDLQRYCSELQFADGDEKSSFEASFNLRHEEKNIYYEQVEYYKNKNKQLQTRADLLLDLNKELKSKLENFGTQNSQSNSQFYKYENNEIKTKVATLEKIIENLSQQKRVLSKQLVSIKSDNSIQIQLEETQHKHRQQNIKLLSKERQIQQLEQELKKYTQKVIWYESESINFKAEHSQREQKISMLELGLKNNETKIWELEQNIQKMSAQKELLKSQYSRAANQFNQKKNQAQKQLNQLRTRIIDLQKDLRGLQLKNDEKSNELYSKDQLLHSYTVKVFNLENNLTLETERGSVFSQKIRQLESKIVEMEAQLSKALTQNNEYLLQLQQKSTELTNLNRQYHQVGTEKSTNLSQISNLEQRIKELEATLERIGSQLQQYKKQKVQLFNQKQVISQENSRIKHQNQLIFARNQQVQWQRASMVQDFSFYTQFISSLLLQIQSLLNQIAIKKQSRSIQIIQQLRQEISKGISHSIEIKEVIS